MAKNGASYHLLIELLCIILVVLLVIMPQIALVDAATDTASIDNGSERTIYVEGYITEGSMRGGMLTQLPISGAVIYFIKNNQVVNQTKSNAIGYYSVIITSGDYSVVTAASGYETLMTEETFRGTRSLNRVLEQIPYNGLVPYALNPVVETSPGRPVSATIVVENSQLIDQFLAFTVNVPNNWVAWFPEGEMLGVRSGATEKLDIMFQYNGDGKGAEVMKVIVNGGPFYAEIPIVVIVKDMPYESLDLYSNAPEKVVKPGTTTNFVFSVNNKYARSKPLLVNISKPDGWGASTLNGTYFYAYQEQIASSDLWVYVPQDAAPGYYFINLTLEGQDTKSNMLQFRVKVEGTPPYDALIKGYKNSEEGYPAINLTDGDPIDIPVRVYNNGDFPLDIYAYAEVGDNWDTYVSGTPWGRVKVEPGGAGEFTVHSKVPNGTTGNYSAKIYLESGDQDQTLIAMLYVKPKQKEPLGDTSLPALLLTGATAGAIVLSLVRASTKKRRKY